MDIATSDNTLTRIEQLLEAFAQAEFSTSSHETTFMEALGVSSKEVPVSSLLAFLLDPNESHGLGTLWIDALVAAYASRLDREVIVDAVENVETEESTGNRKRIDIVIETGNRIIAIENKIYAGLNNPLGDYKKYIEKETTERGKEESPILIVLSLFPLTPDDKDFANITYEQLFAEVRKRLGDHFSADKAHWTIYIDGFMKSISNLENTMAFNPEYDELLSKHYEAAFDFILWRKTYIKETKAELCRIIDAIDFVDEGLLAEGDYKVFAWNSSYYYCCYCIDINLPLDHIIAIENNKSVLTVETWRTKRDGWVITLFVRSGGDSAASLIGKLLDKAGIKWQIAKYYGKEERRYLEVEHLDYEADDSAVRDAIRRAVSYAKKVITVGCE